jgi:acyl-CoA thioesterase-1
MRLYFIILSLTILAACQTSKSKRENNGQPNSYLALGDSYTIGESVRKSERWPLILAKELGLGSPHIIAQTGWRTDQLLAAAKKQIQAHQKYDLVSLLIGVNNQFQSKSIESFRKEFKILLQLAIEHSKSGKKGVFVLSIPDYGCTPYGKSSAKEIGQAINRWNLAIESICIEEGISFYNVTDISRKGLNDPTLVADDGLHPSGKMYQLWVDEISGGVRLKLAN